MNICTVYPFTEINLNMIYKETYVKWFRV